MESTATSGVRHRGHEVSRSLYHVQHLRQTKRLTGPTSASRRQQA